MSVTTINYRFLVRRGTAANLAAVNEIPLAGELIIQIGTGLMKLGDGTTPYNSLAFISSSAPVSMRVSGGYIQFSQDGGATWTNLALLSTLQGPTGATGSIGPTGPTGPIALFLRVSGGNIQWSSDNTTWVTLVPVASLVSTVPGPTGSTGPTGPVGPTLVQLRVSGGQIQSTTDGSTWTNMIALSSLQGPAGADGAAGSPGVDAPTVSRTTISFASPTGVKVKGTLTSPKMFRAFRCEGNNPFRLRLYSTTAERDADEFRLPTVLSPQGCGLLFEFIGDVSLLGANLAPIPTLYNNESTPVASIPFTLEPASAVSTTVNLSIMAIQP